MKALTVSTTTLVVALFGSTQPLASQLPGADVTTHLLTEATQIWGFPNIISFSEFVEGYTDVQEGVQLGAEIGEDVRVQGAGFLGAPEYYYLGWNGEWYSKPAMYLNRESGSFSFFFAEAVSAVGSVINFYNTDSSFDSNVFIEILHADGSVLASHRPDTYLPERMFDTGPFVGFQRATADIAEIRFSNGYVAVDDLTFARSTVTPEPVTMVLLGSGLAGIGAAVRRRRRREELCREV